MSNVVRHIFLKHKLVTMKNRILPVIIFLLSAFCLVQQKSYANHAAGGELIYIHLSDSTYQFIFKFYRDCRGPAAPAEFDLCAFNTCTNQSFFIDLKQWLGPLPPDNRPQGTPVSPGCSNAKTQCDSPGSIIPGYQEWWYHGTATLPVRCNYWRFSAVVGTTALCCRNSSTNLQGTPNFYIETTFNTSVQHHSSILYKDPVTKMTRQRGPWDNSSPYYSVKPIPYVCINEPYTYNNGAIDSDGDSLSSQMINPLATTSCTSTPTLAPLQNLTPPINFNTNPFPTNNTFSLNAASGQMSFTPNVQGGGAITIRTREFSRDNNNVVREIGSIMRDVQVQVIACSTVTPVIADIYVDPGIDAIVQNGRILGCMNSPLKFCFKVATSDTAGRLILEDNLITSIPDAKITYTNTGTDTVTGCFEWLPAAKDVGIKRFILIIKDSTCRPPGVLFQYVHNIELFIWGKTQATPDTSICSGEPAFLGVTGGGDYEWTILSGTNPSLNNHFIPNPVATPAVTTVYQVTSRANNYCPNINKDTVNIAVMQGPDIAGQPDVLTCPNYEVSLDVGITKVPGATYNIKWTPAAGLTSDVIENPKVKIKNTQTYNVAIGSDVNRCKTFDTVLVDVLTGVSLENQDTGICLGQRVDVRGIGDARYDYQWKSPTDPSVTFTNAGGILTAIIPSDTGLHKFVLHATHVNCPGKDSTVNFSIDVQPIPTVAINEDESLCFGDTMQLTAIVTPNTFHRYSYAWTPGAALDYPDRKTPIFSAIDEGITTLTFIARTPAGCSDTDEITLNVYSAEFITVPNDTAICAGDTISLAITTTDVAKFYWVPDFNISSISSLQPRVWPVTNQTYSVYATDKFGCLDTGVINVAVRPRAIIELADSVRLYPGESYRMDPGGNCLYYTWFPPLGLSNADVSNPSVSPKVNTRYIVHGRTESGCTAIDSIDVYVSSQVLLTLPNAFTPGSNKNNRLKAVRRGTVELKQFAVYNRWGTKVFETSDINEGWDGNYRGEAQPTGVFIYTLEAIAPNGETIHKQGNVTLIR